MTVYVDGQRNNYGRMKMCHMVADTKEELLEMVDKIGVNRKWIQKENTPYEHFDISLGKRKLAIENGAVAVSSKELIKNVIFPKKGLTNHKG